MSEGRRLLGVAIRQNAAFHFMVLTFYFFLKPILLPVVVILHAMLWTLDFSIPRLPTIVLPVPTAPAVVLRVPTLPAFLFFVPASPDIFLRPPVLPAVVVVATPLVRPHQHGDGPASCFSRHASKEFYLLLQSANLQCTTPNSHQ